MDGRGETHELQRGVRRDRGPLRGDVRPARRHLRVVLRLGEEVVREHRQANGANRIDRTKST